jgi:alkyl sulfatase BDS1-like metallo-beta-lactamase superfamily hydrolase
VLAAAGYWYDALELLAQQIAADDRSQPWRELGATLLEQAGLQQVAAFARGQRAPQSNRITSSK